MKVRELRSEDAEKLKSIYVKRGLAEYFPNLNDALFLTKLVLVDDQDIPRIAGALRLEANSYVFVDPGWGTPLERWQAFLEIHKAVTEEASLKGLDQLTCQVPPQLEKGFGKRIMRLGWNKLLWTTYAKGI